VSVSNLVAFPGAIFSLLALIGLAVSIRAFIHKMYLYAAANVSLCALSIWLGLTMTHSGLREEIVGVAIALLAVFLNVKSRTKDLPKNSVMTLRDRE